MDWIDLLGGADFLRSLFLTAPSLQGVRVREVDLHEDGPRILLRFDLNTFPAEPPAKWRQSLANRVQVRLMGIGVRDFEVRGWTANTFADVEIAAAGSGGVRLVAQGPGFRLSATFDHVAVDHVSAYSDAAV